MIIIYINKYSRDLINFLLISLYNSYASNYGAANAATYKTTKVTLNE